MKNYYKYFGFFLLLIIVLRVITRFFVFSTKYTLNDKMVFGLFFDNLWATVFLILFFTAFSLWYYFKPKFQFPIMLISAGILSNLLDRIFFGGVVDYLDVWYIPTFNLADVLIVVGALFLTRQYIKQNLK